MVVPGDQRRHRSNQAMPRLTPIAVKSVSIHNLFIPIDVGSVGLFSYQLSSWHAPSRTWRVLHSSEEAS